MSIVVIWKGRAFWPSMTRVASLRVARLVEKRGTHLNEDVEGSTALSKCHGYDLKKFKLTFDAESARDEVAVHRFADERERPRGPQVALDDLDVVVPRHELDVDGARNV